MKKNNKRKINGILLLDKPRGITSNEALQIVKRLYNADKAGHTGSLDPIATGMLPLCFGEATKFSQFLLDADKRYLVTAKLGIATASGDTEGEIIAVKPLLENIAEKIPAILEKFRGKISQLPSMYSAIKHHGEPLYKLARKGITVERKPREVTIFSLQLLQIINDTLQLSVHCSKGTYIRTLVADIGDALGCGAHVIELRRLAAGPYQETQMVSMDVLQQLAQTADFVALDKLLLPIETMVNNWNEMQFSQEMLYYLLQGQPLVVPGSVKPGWVKIKNKDGKFYGVGEVVDGHIVPRKLVHK